MKNILPDQARTRRVRIRDLIIAVFLIGLIVWLYGVLYYTIRTGTHFSQLRSSLTPEQFVEFEIQSLEAGLRTTGETIPKLARDIKILQTITGPLYPILNIGSHLPVVGPYAEQAQPLLAYATELSQAANLMHPALVALLEIVQNEAGMEEIGAASAQILEDNASSFDQAAQALTRASQARMLFDPDLLPEKYAGTIYWIDENFDTLLQTVRLLAVAPGISGTADQPHSYLLLAQNRDELRATGGFITGIGLAKIANGKLISLEIADSYQVDDLSKGYPPPPEPLQKFMLADFWMPRDANWSPDFPTSARKAQELYTLSTGQETDGVIAFDQDAIISLVAMVGPLELEQFPEAVRADNVELIMQQAWETSPHELLSKAWWEQRKDFMTPIGKAIIDRILNINDVDQFISLARLMLSNIRSGHILLYSDQNDLQAFLVQAGLDNGLHPGDGDFLLLVDSNIGFNKVDAVMYRELSYFVDFSSNEIVSKMGIDYTHLIADYIPCVHESTYGSGEYTDTRKRCYWDYWRAYTMQGALLYNSPTTPIAGEFLLNGEDWHGEVTTASGENNTQVISGLFVLPTNQHKDIDLEFILPSDVLQPVGFEKLVYTLRVQKQAGVDNLPFDLHIKPPTGYQMVAPDSPWQFDQGADSWIWSGNISQTKTFNLTFTPKQQ